MTAIRKSLALALILLFAVAELATASHPFHVSRAEIEYNVERQTFEVALCFWPEDMEQAISDMENKPFRIDGASEKDRDAAFQKYVTKKFRFLPESEDQKQQPEAADVRWVGSDIEVKQAWLYFEVDAKCDAVKWQIENRLFFELHDDQLNNVQIKNRKDVNSLTLSASQPTTNWSQHKPEVR